MINSVLAKAQKFCAYQERSHEEVRTKLLQWQVYGDELEEILYQLIADGFLNEGRFASVYTRSKFNQKSWGRIKIKNALKLKGVTPKCIEISLDEIDPVIYKEKLRQLFEKKASDLDLRDYSEKVKVIRYLQNKGYELDLIMEVVNNG